MFREIRTSEKITDKFEVKNNEFMNIEQVVTGRSVSINNKKRVLKELQQHLSNRNRRMFTIDDLFVEKAD